MRSKCSLHSESNSHLLTFRAATRASTWHTCHFWSCRACPWGRLSKRISLPWHCNAFSLRMNELFCCSLFFFVLFLRNVKNIMDIFFKASLIIMYYFFRQKIFLLYLGSLPFPSSVHHCFQETFINEWYKKIDFWLR